MDYKDLLWRSGWRQSERLDVTPEHRSSLGALVKGLTESAELSEVLGPEVMSETSERRIEQIEAIDAGLLVREVFSRPR